jgi:hypothetical protein
MVLEVDEQNELNFCSLSKVRLDQEMESSKLLLRKARLKKMAEVGGNKY